MELQPHGTAALQAVGSSCVARLVRDLELGQGGDVETAAAAAAALTNITMTKEGKLACSEVGWVTQPAYWGVCCGGR